MAQEELQESKLTKAGGRKPTHGCNYPMVGWPSVILTPVGPSLNLTREGTSRPSLRSALSLSLMPCCGLKGGAVAFSVEGWVVTGWWGGEVRGGGRKRFLEGGAVGYTMEGYVAGGGGGSKGAKGGLGRWSSKFYSWRGGPEEGGERVFWKVKQRVL